MPEAAQRVLSACVFVPGVLALLWLGDWALFALVAAIIGRGTWEFYHMAAAAGHRPLGLVGSLLALGLSAHIFAFGAAGLELAIAVSIIIVLSTALFRGTQGYVANALITLGGVLYIGFLGSAPLLLEQRLAAAGQSGGWVLMLVLGSLWLTDAAAYLGGRALGRHKLAPTISPGKTIEGFVAGLAGGLPLLALNHLVPLFSWEQLAGLLLLLGLGGQLGDLIESAIKRDLGLKDAPPLIPGHGGVLDRFDSYFFAFPLAYAYVEWVVL